MKSLLHFTALILFVHTCNGWFTPTYDPNVTYKTYNFDAPRPPDVACFEQATKSPYFVDKTSLIKLFLNTPYILITCPKKFGKSTNLDMLRRFYQLHINKTGHPINRKTTHDYKLFTDKSLNLNISKDQNFIEQHFGKYPVLYFDFTNITGVTCAEVYNSTLEKVLDAVAPYSFLYFKIKDKLELTNHTVLQAQIRMWKRFFNETRNRYNFVFAMEVVTEAIQKHFGKPAMVFMDGYDTPAMHLLNIGVWASGMNYFVQSLIELYARNTDQASHFIIAGVCRYFTMFPYTKLIYNYFLHNNVYAEYFGFTGTDVHRLLTANKIDNETRLKLKKHFNGYTFKPYHVHHATNETSLYHPKGVLRYLQNKTFDDYGLMEDNITTSLMTCIRHERFFNDIMTLLKMKTVGSASEFHMLEEDLIDFRDIVRSSCDELPEFFPYILHYIDNGYLTPVRKSYRIANVIANRKLQRDFQRAYLVLHGINIKNSQTISTLRAILNSKFTTDEVLTSLSESLQNIIQPRLDNSWESELNSYEFRTIIIGTLYSSFDFYEDTVRVSELGWKTETLFNHSDLLKVPSNDRKTLLIINVSFRVSLNDSIEEARKYVPFEPRKTSVVNLVKYLAINLKEDGKVEVGKGEDRDDWCWMDW